MQYRVFSCFVSGRCVVAAISSLLITGCSSPVPSAEDQVIELLASDAPYHLVPEALFAELGWDLPDGGETVRQLADAAAGGAFDPRALESVRTETLGYSARWHEVRFNTYGFDWDIGGLHLVPAAADAGLPTMVIINGGAANWYEFFLGPKNHAGLGQYLAQKIPVLLVTIPGNYRHGGWTEPDLGERIPGYLLDQDVSPEEARVRNAVYTFRVVTDGVKALLEQVIDGPLVIIGHSTGGEVQFILNDALADKTRDLSMGWGTGGPAGMNAMQEFRGVRSIGRDRRRMDGRRAAPQGAIQAAAAGHGTLEHGLPQGRYRGADYRNAGGQCFRHRRR
jgi:pimeloyl-ACP methyl ester carboxylesterase